MTKRVEDNPKTLNKSTESIALRHNQKQEMDQQYTDFSYSGVTHQSVNTQIKLANGRGFGKLSALLAERNGLNTCHCLSAKPTGIKKKKDIHGSFED